ncbi:MAG: hypothetical protein OIN86_09200 [Candidatus Methanoperedens sp.]|nr:hypothetical protein [Candidatus Methanoperedens sp.]
MKYIKSITNQVVPSQIIRMRSFHASTVNPVSHSSCHGSRHNEVTRPYWHYSRWEHLLKALKWYSEQDVIHGS